MTSSNLGDDCLTRITYDTKDVAGLKKKRLKILRHTATTNRITRAKVYVILAPKELRKLQIATIDGNTESHHLPLKSESGSLFFELRYELIPTENALEELSQQINKLRSMGPFTHESSHSAETAASS